MRWKVRELVRLVRSPPRWPETETSALLESKDFETRVGRASLRKERKGREEWGVTTDDEEAVSAKGQNPVNPDRIKPSFDWRQSFVDVVMCTSNKFI